MKDEMRVCHPLILFPYSIHCFEVQGVLLRRKKKRFQYSLQMETKPRRGCLGGGGDMGEYRRASKTLHGNRIWAL